MEPNEEKLLHCYICKATKRACEFYINKSRGTGRDSSCKKCNHTYLKRRNTLKKYHEKNSPKVRAWHAVRNALRNGSLKRGLCEVCGNKKVHAHHNEGYKKEKRLTVQWLCSTHHKLAHGK